MKTSTQNSIATVDQKAVKVNMFVKKSAFVACGCYVDAMWMQCGCSEVWKSVKKLDLWGFGEARGPRPLGALGPGPLGARAPPRNPTNRLF